MSEISRSQALFDTKVSDYPFHCSDNGFFNLKAQGWTVFTRFLVRTSLAEVSTNLHDHLARILIAQINRCNHEFGFSDEEAELQIDSVVISIYRSRANSRFIFTKCPLHF